ncbi:MAG: Do family serine endopeptidase [Thermoguttaceae bacterium]
MAKQALPLERRFGAVFGMTLLGLALCQSPARPAEAPPTGDKEAIDQANSLSRAFRAAAKSVIPTVVTVRTTTKAGATADGSPFRGSPLEDLFGSPDRRHPMVPLPGMGSGVIIGEGLVLTNNHVVEGADTVTIDLSDGRRLEVVDIKTDPQSDLAVLHVKSDEPLPVAKLGDSDKLDIGDWVIAVGNPFELEQTVSAGIISAKGRSLGSVERARFLQTDAAINPGNSGGPLVNLSGEVIGINTAIFSRSGGYQGIGFAIPINLAKWVTPQLAESGSVRRAYLGVGIGAVTPERAKELGVTPNAGVVVENIIEGSPAAKAGLQQEDVILSFDGRVTRNVADLQEIVERAGAGSKHALSVLRDGKSLDLEVVVESMPADLGRTARVWNGSPKFHRDEKLGLTVMDLSDYMAGQLGFRGKKGALIMDVDKSRPAGRAGLADGMLIQKVNGKAVSGVTEFVEAMKGASVGEGIALEVLTEAGPRTIQLKSP